MNGEKATIWNQTRRGFINALHDAIDEYYGKE